MIGGLVRPHRRELLLFIAILLPATALRVGWPNLTEFKFSEARLETLALEVTRGGRLPLVGVPSSAGFDHSPISVYLYTPAFLLTSSPIPATIYGGLVGVGAVVLCWWLARRLPGGGRRAALVSALLLAVSPWSVAFSRKIWQVVFVPPLTLAVIGWTLSALVEEPAGQRRWRLAWALVAYALLVQVHPSAISLAPAFVLWLLVFCRRIWNSIGVGPLLAGGGAGALTAIPFLVHQVQNGWPALAALRALPEAIYDLSTVRLAWEAITGRGIHALAGDAYPLLRIVPQLGWIFNLVGWLAVAASLWLLWRLVTNWQKADIKKRRIARVDLILLSWLLVPIVFNLRHTLDLHLHFFTLVVPAAYLIIGRAIEAIPQTGKAAWVNRVGWAGLGLLAIVQVLALVLMGSFVSSHETPGGFGTPLGHYQQVADEVVAVAAQEEAAEVLVVGQGDSIVVDEVPAIFDALLRDRVELRFVDSQSAALFPAHRSLALLIPGAGQETAWYEPWPAWELRDGYRLVALDGSWPHDNLSPMPGPRLFQNGVELQGYRWETPAAPEGEGSLWLLWQVLWLDVSDTHFYVQILNPAEQLLGKQDATGYPTAYRQKGDRVISKFDITVNGEVRPGLESMQVGMYRYPEVVSIPVIDGAGNVVGDTVRSVLEGREP